RGIPQSQREHSAQRREAFDPTLFVEVDDHLDVRPGLESMPAGRERVSLCVEAVDLAVADHDHGAVLAPDRLLTARRIHDGAADDATARDSPPAVSKRVVAR